MQLEAGEAGLESDDDVDDIGVGRTTHTHAEPARDDKVSTSTNPVVVYHQLANGNC